MRETQSIAFFRTRGSIVLGRTDQDAIGGADRGGEVR
jgi:hypothetical protein